VPCRPGTALNFAYMRAIAAICVLLAVKTSPAQSPDLKYLYDAHDWIKLRDALRNAKSPPVLYRAAVASAFNQPGQAEKLLRSLIKSTPASPQAYEAHEILAHIYLRAGQYRRLISNMEARWAAFPDKSNVQEERTVMEPFRDLPDQETAGVKPSTLRHNGDISLPVSINGGAAKYFFDTGAAVSCMSESEAKRLGLTIRETTGTLGTSTGARTAFRTAVAAQLTLGNVQLRNVSFAVFPDDQEPWVDLPPAERGLLGRPILLAFRTLRWAHDGTVRFGSKSLPGRRPKSNFYFDEDSPVVVTRLGQESVLVTLDTGAETTDLYAGFAKQFPALLSESGKKDSTEVRGVGHAETFDSVTIPELTFRLGDIDTVLRPAHVLLKHPGNKCCVGNIGLDLLKQGRAFKIDFGAMTLELEP
jgi:predicted aspartyl protease